MFRTKSTLKNGTQIKGAIRVLKRFHKVYVITLPMKSARASRDGSLNLWNILGIDCKFFIWLQRTTYFLWIWSRLWLKTHLLQKVNIFLFVQFSLSSQHHRVHSRITLIFSTLLNNTNFKRSQNSFITCFANNKEQKRTEFSSLKCG